MNYNICNTYDKCNGIIVMYQNKIKANICNKYR